MKTNEYFDNKKFQEKNLQSIWYTLVLCTVCVFCLFLNKDENQLWQSGCDSWMSSMYHTKSQIFGTVNRNWADQQIQEVFQHGNYCISVSPALPAEIYVTKCGS